jgi:CBS domain containing-hemolysin-like protein
LPPDSNAAGSNGGSEQLRRTGGPAVTPAEAGFWARLGRRLGRPEVEAPPALRPEEAAIARALGRLRETTARDVMTPRVDVVALPEPVSPEDVTRAVKESGHSRFPVHGETLDDLRGVLFVKDLFRIGETPSAETIARRLRKPFVVPESSPVIDLITDMRERRRAFAVVIDEHGGVEGVLTVKDLLGELVGDLRDEFDEAGDDPQVARIDDRRWLLDGAVPVDEASEALGVELPEGEYVTLGGLLLDRLGHIPEEGEEVQLHDWRFKVSSMDRHRIEQVVATAPTAHQA